MRARESWEGTGAPPLTIVGIVLIAMVVARTVHHWSGVPFEFDSMVESTTLQASLSIVWGLGGLSGMVVGVRLARRMVWVGGASLMGLVVVKLFLFDLANTGTLERVVSFLGVGVLLLVVGYLAPVPPSDSTQSGGNQTPSGPGTLRSHTGRQLSSATLTISVRDVAPVPRSGCPIAGEGRATLFRPLRRNHPRRRSISVWPACRTR